MNTREQKASVREQVRGALRQLPPTARATDSALICKRVQNCAPWRAARSVLLYHALPDEPELDALIRAALADGKLVALPRYSAESAAYEAARVADLARDCGPGRYGVMEPAPHCPSTELNQLDFALVPGVAFDPAGRRLGRGKGYYDRLLERFRGIKCGVAFDFQIVAGLPAEPHDAILNCLATPTRWMECPPANRL